MNIIFDSININNLSGNSGVFNGENTQSNWNSYIKNNFGQGSIIGKHNIFYQNVNVVEDNDLIDFPVRKAKEGNGN